MDEKKKEQHNNRHKARKLAGKHLVLSFEQSASGSMTLKGFAAIDGKIYLMNDCNCIDTEQGKRAFIRGIAYMYNKDHGIDDGMKLEGGG